MERKTTWANIVRKGFLLRLSKDCEHGKKGVNAVICHVSDTGSIYIYLENGEYDIITNKQELEEKYLYDFKKTSAIDDYQFTHIFSFISSFKIGKFDSAFNKKESDLTAMKTLNNNQLSSKQTKNGKKIAKLRLVK